MIKKSKKDEVEDDAGDEEAASVKTDEEDGSEKVTILCTMGCI